MSEVLSCPVCGAALTSEMIACPSCDVLLEQTPTPHREISIVRALLSPPEWSRLPEPAQKRKIPIHEQVTARTMVLDESSLPRLTAEIDLALRPLEPLEAQVVSLLDGRTSVAQIVGLTQLALVEVRAVLYSLLERKIVELGRPEPLAAPKTVEDENVLEKVIGLERQGDTERAIDLLSRAIARSGRPAPLYNKLALILLNQRQAFHPAEALLKKAIRLDPGNVVYEQNLARLVRLAGPR